MVMEGEESHRKIEFKNVWERSATEQNYMSTDEEK